MIWTGVTLCPVSSASDVVNAYWIAANDRAWEAFAELLDEDVIYEGPQARERVRGSESYVRFNSEGFAGDWHLKVVRIVGERRYAASWIEFTNADGSTQPGLCFFELNDASKIVRITDFWPDPYELPTSREHLVQRY
jgi:hypothetical protein